MITTEQGKIVAGLIRKNARILRGESFKTLRLINSLIRAREANVPEQFLLPFSFGLRKAIAATRFDKSVLPQAVGSLFIKNRHCTAANLAAMEDFAARIRNEFACETENAVLAADGAALSGLYQDLGAFPGAHWTALLRDGTYANGSNRRMLGMPEDDWSEKTQFGKTFWRKPKPALLVTLLAAHVGSAAAHPTPPMWPHMGLALLAWKESVGVKEILAIGSKLDLLEDVERGLAIAAHIFPELASWVNVDELLIPGWEKKFAIPLAARRLMVGERE